MQGFSKCSLHRSATWAKIWRPKRPTFTHDVMSSRNYSSSAWMIQRRISNGDVLWPLAATKIWMERCIRRKNLNLITVLRLHWQLRTLRQQISAKCSSSSSATKTCFYSSTKSCFQEQSQPIPLCKSLRAALWTIPIWAKVLVSGHRQQAIRRCWRDQVRCWIDAPILSLKSFFAIL